MPDLAARRDRAAAALGLGLPGQDEVRARLREVATRLGGEDFVLIFMPEGHPYERFSQSEAQAAASRWSG